jgi:hypothetical protein
MAEDEDKVEVDAQALGSLPGRLAPHAPRV